MKKIKLLSLLLSSAMILTACSGGNKEASTSASDDKAQTEEVKDVKKWQSVEKKDEMTDKVSTVMTLECPLTLEMKNQITEPDATTGYC